MTSLNKKLFRDLWSMKGQALAIGLVMASGASTFVMAISTRDSLEFTRVSYYAEKRFPDVFASLKRAPESLKGRLRAIPGVQQVETRVIAPANLEVEDYPDPVTGRLVSIPDFGEPLLNGLHLMRGRLPDSVRDDEVVVHDSFARAHEFEPGDRIVAVINGRRKRLRIVGIALSPEHVFPIQPGSFIPDDQSYGVMWMARTPIEAAYDMEGAFNDVSLSLAAGVQLEEVIDRVDELLDRYGGLGAYGPRGSALAPLSERGDETAQSDGDALPGDFLGRRGVPVERSSEPADSYTARASGHSEGLRVLERGGRLAFHEAGADDGGSRGRRGRMAGRVVRARDERDVHGFLSLPLPSLRIGTPRRHHRRRCHSRGRHCRYVLFG